MADCEEYKLCLTGEPNQCKTCGQPKNQHTDAARTGSVRLRKSSARRALPASPKASPPPPPEGRGAVGGATGRKALTPSTPTAAAPKAPATPKVSAPRAPPAKPTVAAVAATTAEVGGKWVEALFAFQGEAGELSFPAGALIRVTATPAGDGWLAGTTKDGSASGLFPENYVKPAAAPPSASSPLKTVGKGVDGGDEMENQGSSFAYGVDADSDMFPGLPDEEDDDDGGEEEDDDEEDDDEEEGEEEDEDDGGGGEGGGKGGVYDHGNSTSANRTNGGLNNGTGGLNGSSADAGERPEEEEKDEGMIRHLGDAEYGYVPEFFTSNIDAACALNTTSAILFKWDAVAEETLFTVLRWGDALREAEGDSEETERNGTGQQPPWERRGKKPSASSFFSPL